MEDFLQQVFLFEIAMQSRFIVLAKANLDAIEPENDARGEQIQMAQASGQEVDLLREYEQFSRDLINREWLALQSIVVSAANLSKLLWGSGGRRAEERKPLRDRLEISDDSSLQSPDLRNDFEHFDERIELRFSQTESRGYVGRNIGPVGAIRVEGEEPDTRFGHYDPSTGVLSFWANSVNVGEIVAEAERIFPLAENEALKAHWVE